MRPWSALLAVVLFLSSRVASAQDTDATASAAARALFSEGVTAADAADWATAADRFGRARALRSSPTIALNLAVALSHLGRLVEASELLQAVLHDPTSTDAIRAGAHATVAEIEPRLAWIELDIEGPLEGVTIDADGQSLPLELVGAPVPMDPGHHCISASRGAAVVASAEVDLTEGSRAPVPLVIPPPVEEALAVPVDEGDAEGPIATSGGGDDGLLIGLGIGGGVLVLGGMVALVVVLAMPGEPSPFVGNAGVLEIGR
jgi:hypothetical protein